MLVEELQGSGAAHVRGRRIALALEAASRDAHGYEKRALDCVLPAPGNGHTNMRSRRCGVRTRDNRTLIV